MAVRKPPKRTYASLLSGIQIDSPRQIQKRANVMTAAQTKAQRGLILDEAARARREALARQRSMQAAGQAAAEMGKGLIGDTGSAYADAARQLASLGTLSGMTQGANAASLGAANAALANVGAPSVAGSPGQAAVQDYLGVTLPGQALQEGGTAATFGTAGIINALQARATQEANAGLRQATRDISEQRYAGLRELARNRPVLAREVLAQLQDANRQQVALAMSLMEGQRARQGEQFTQKMTVRQQRAAEKAQAQENVRRSQELQLQWGEVDPIRSQALGYLVNRRGQPILQGGKRISAAKLAQATTKRSMTPGQASALMQKAQDFAETAFYGYGKDENGKRVPITQLGSFDPNDPSTYGSGGLDYGRALARLTRMGVTPAAAQSLLSEYYERGDSGRPLFTAAEMKRARKAFGAGKFNAAVRTLQSLLERGQTAVADRLIQEILMYEKGTLPVMSTYRPYLGNR